MKKLNEDLAKYETSDLLKREDERLDALDNNFCVDIRWNQIKKFRFQ